MPTLVQLREKAKARGLKGYSRMNKAELEAALYKPLSPKQKKTLRDVFKGGEYRGVESKKKMSKCKRCCGTVTDGKCSYPMCKKDTCSYDCDSIKRSKLSARINKYKSKTNSPKKMEEIYNKLDKVYKEHCE